MSTRDGPTRRQTGRSRRRTLLFRLAAAGLAAAASPAGASAGQFEITLTGSEGARFEMRCEVEGGPGGRFGLTGPVPATRTFSAERLACTIRQTVPGATLRVEARSSAGNLTRLSTHGAGSRLVLRLQ